MSYKQHCSCCECGHDWFPRSPSFPSRCPKCNKRLEVHKIQMLEGGSNTSVTVFMWDIEKMNALGLLPVLQHFRLDFTRGKWIEIKHDNPNLPEVKGIDFSKPFEV